MLILNLNGVRRCSRHAYHAAATPILKSNRCLQAPATLILDWNGVRKVEPPRLSCSTLITSLNGGPEAQPPRPSVT